jgi:hypothetical protein
MKTYIDLSTVPADGELDLFAIVNLGITSSLEQGLLNPMEATGHFFNHDNCQFVRDSLKDEPADEIMGRGLQLADLFDALPAEEAEVEFQRELGEIRSLCSQLLGKQSVA